MKKNFDLAEIIKEAVKEGVLEAFAQMYGIATTDGEPETPGAGNGSGGEAEDGDNSGNNNNNGGNNNSGSGNNNGGGPVEPDPIWGPVGINA